MKKDYWLAHSTILALSLGAVVRNPIPNVSAQEIPKAQCKESSWSGQVTCGYSCVESSWNGQVACASWPGGACKESSWNGQITCGPPAPPGWFSSYTNTPNSGTSTSSIHGAWVVKMSDWNGILRMRGNIGTMVLTSKNGASVEQKMSLKENPEGGYILNGKVLTSYIRGQYYADNFYIERFTKDSMSIRTCDRNQNCNSANLIYLGK